MTPSRISLTLSTLSGARSGRTLYQGLDLSLMPGEAALLRGPNGAGKSSLLRQICGFLPVTVGSITLRDDTGLPVDPTDAIALLEEAPALKPSDNLYQMLQFHSLMARGYPIADQDIEQMAHALDLLPLLDVPLRFFSTGQRRRAALARLALSGRAIWLLDEPLNGLDTASRAATARLLHQHLNAGGSMIVASHDPVDIPIGHDIDLARYAAPMAEAQL